LQNASLNKRYTELKHFWGKRRPKWLTLRQLWLWW